MLAAAKWDAYYSTGRAPFDSGRPASQLVHLVCSCTAELVQGEHGWAQQQAGAHLKMVLPPQQPPSARPPLHTCPACAGTKPPAGGRVLELGCGTGASARWLAHQGWQVTAVDVSRAALQAAAQAAAAEGLTARNPTWLQQDVMRLREPGARAGCQQQQQQSLAGSFHFIYDCQVYHVLVRDQPDCQQRLPHLLHDLLAPGGLLMILAGNAREPEVGPNTLTAEQLLQPLLAGGLQVVWLHESRFDNTHHYDNVLGLRPLAWWALLRRPGSAADA